MTGNRVIRDGYAPCAPYARGRASKPTRSRRRASPGSVLLSLLLSSADWKPTANPIAYWSSSTRPGSKRSPPSRWVIVVREKRGFRDQPPRGRSLLLGIGSGSDKALIAGCWSAAMDKGDA